MVKLAVFLASEEDEDDEEPTWWICANALTGASIRTSAIVDARRLAIEATSRRQRRTALSRTAAACWVPAGPRPYLVDSSSACPIALSSGQVNAVYFRARMTSTICAWMRPFDATTSPVRESNGPPASPVTWPPPSSTITAPAETSHGFSLTSQNASRRPAAT